MSTMRGLYFAEKKEINRQLGSNLCRHQIGSLDESISVRSRNTGFILKISL